MKVTGCHTSLWAGWRGIWGLLQTNGWQYWLFFLPVWVIGSVLWLHVLMLRKRVGSTGKCDTNGWHQQCFVCMYVWFYMFMCPLSHGHLYVKFTVISHKNKSSEKEIALSCLWSRAPFFNTCWVSVFRHARMKNINQRGLIYEILWQENFQSFKITNN